MRNFHQPLPAQSLLMQPLDQQPILNDDTALSVVEFATKYQNKELLVAHLCGGSRVDPDDKKKAFLAAVEADDHEIAAIFLQHGGLDVNEMKIKRESYQNEVPVIFEVAMCCSVDMLMLFIEHGISVDAKDIIGTSLAFYIVGSPKDTLSKLNYIKQIGANFSVVVKNRETLMHYAARMGKKKALKWLLKEDNDQTQVNARNKFGETPAHHAAKNGHSNLFLLLARHGADFTIRDKKERMPIHHAADNGHLQSIKEIHENTPENDRKLLVAFPKDSVTLLSYAVTGAEKFEERENERNKTIGFNHEAEVDFAAVVEFLLQIDDFITSPKGKPVLDALIDHIRYDLPDDALEEIVSLLKMAKPAKSPRKQTKKLPVAVPEEKIEIFYFIDRNISFRIQSFNSIMNLHLINDNPKIKFEAEHLAELREIFKMNGVELGDLINLDAAAVTKSPKNKKSPQGTAHYRKSQYGCPITIVGEWQKNELSVALRKKIIEFLPQDTLAVTPVAVVSNDKDPHRDDEESEIAEKERKKKQEEFMLQLSRENKLLSQQRNDRRGAAFSSLFSMNTAGKGKVKKKKSAKKKEENEKKEKLNEEKNKCREQKRRTKQVKQENFLARELGYVITKKKNNCSQPKALSAKSQNGHPVTYKKTADSPDTANRKAKKAYIPFRAKFNKLKARQLKNDREKTLDVMLVLIGELMAYNQKYIAEDCFDECAMQAFHRDLILYGNELPLDEFNDCVAAIVALSKDGLLKPNFCIKPPATQFVKNHAHRLALHIRQAQNIKDILAKIKNASPSHDNFLTLHYRLARLMMQLDANFSLFTDHFHWSRPLLTLQGGFILHDEDGNLNCAALQQRAAGIDDVLHVARETQSFYFDLMDFDASLPRDDFAFWLEEPTEVLNAATYSQNTIVDFSLFAPPLASNHHLLGLTPALPVSQDDDTQSFPFGELFERAHQPSSPIVMASSPQRKTRDVNGSVSFFSSSLFPDTKNIATIAREISTILEGFAKKNLWHMDEVLSCCQAISLSLNKLGADYQRFPLANCEKFGALLIKVRDVRQDEWVRGMDSPAVVALAIAVKKAANELICALRHELTPAKKMCSK